MRRSGIITALACIAVFLSACGSPDEHALNGTQMASSPPTSASGSAAETPLPVPTPEALGNVRNLTEAGFYVLEPATRSLWRMDHSYGSSGAWSPDGSSFVRFGPDRRNVDVVDLAMGSAWRVFSGELWHFSWSPEGNQMAFSTSEGIFTVYRDGSEFRRLASIDGRGGMAWSPRGDLIASAERYAVRVTDVSTGESKVVSPEVGPGDYLGFSSWLPDGGSLLFCSSPSTGAEVHKVSAGTYLYDLTGASAIMLADNCGALLSPDGRSYAYSDDYGVYLASVDGTESARLLAAGYDLGGWLPDGSALALGRKSCLTGDHDIYSMQVDSDEVVRVTDSSDVPKESAGWSPAANRVAYSALLSDRQALFLLDMNTGELRELLTSAREFHIHGPRWSPDGRYISFSGGGGHGAC